MASEKEDNSDFLVGLSSTISMIGPKYFCNPQFSAFRRVVWFLLVVSAFTFMIYQIYDRINQYMEEPVSASYTIVTPKSLRVPSITICSLNPLLTSYLNKTFGGDFSMLKLFDSPCNFSASRASNLHDNISYSTSLTDGAIPLQDVLVFPLSSFSGYPLYPSNFTPYLTMLGMCYRFDAEYEINRGGRSGGLGIVLNANTHEYIEDNMFESSVGFKIFVHERGQIPDTLNRGIRVSPGYEYDLNIMTTKYQFLETPRGICNKSVALRYYNNTYSKNACEEECFADIMDKECSCKWVTQPGPFPVCNTLSDYLCGSCIYTRMHELFSTDKCSLCDWECDHTVFDMSVFTSDLSDQFIRMVTGTVLSNMNISTNVSDSIAQLKNSLPVKDLQNMLKELEDSNENLSFLPNIRPPSPLTQYLRKNIMKLWIYFGQISYTHIKQQPAYTVWAMLSDIGGAMGLFLGGAIFTVLEAIDFAIGYGCCKNRSKLRLQSHSKNSIQAFDNHDKNRAEFGVVAGQ